jgi:hypothetical protein
MAVELDISNLPYQTAYSILTWCYDNSIDLDNCVQTLYNLCVADNPGSMIINVPEEYVSYILLKWL